MTTVPLTDWSQNHREQHFHSIVGGGWLRMRPLMLWLLLMASSAVAVQKLAEAQMVEILRKAPQDYAAGCVEYTQTVPLPDAPWGVREQAVDRRGRPYERIRLFPSIKHTQEELLPSFGVA
ncbi:hypothetical protein [Streptomyces capitiformicae]|uniref:Uncharacterized protein n=1 Tax=Streptomyces capitiformicae TaxID=2014920 RepID=A0A918Z202_9ACTN|nr:hypothetical protein [Streptomyces capitiformicae]GHE33824.1 hypothetical protein GCM10017771_51050 [Streptomyces capitiformicae]